MGFHFYKLKTRESSVTFRYLYITDVFQVFHLTWIFPNNFFLWYYVLLKKKLVYISRDQIFIKQTFFRKLEHAQSRLEKKKRIYKICSMSLMQTQEWHSIVSSHAGLSFWLALKQITFKNTRLINKISVTILNKTFVDFFIS